MGPARGSVEPPVAKDLWLQWLSSLREMLAWLGSCLW